MADVRIVIEETPKKAFASALDWPGWSRSGKTGDAAVEALLAYAARYRPVAERAGCAWNEPEGPELVDRLPGDASTEFGVPGQVHAPDQAPLEGDELQRHIALLTACWEIFFEVAGRVTPELRKGPRGGGRDRDKIVAHVVESDRSYARQLGVTTKPFPLEPLDREAFEAHWQAVLAAIPAYADGHTRTGKGWPLRYTIRRMAWHILDHAWEMEDKTLA
ncbi:MAG TPA: hypothetical protein VNP95_09950 [Thermomicrobiales bacterium]|nr:hypothetical protein [Thermomicrobiales bacterium]